MSPAEWSTKLFEESFEQRRDLYGSRSLFVLIYSQEGIDYDREVLGEALLPDDDWGCIDPPGPSGGFGDVLTSERIEASNGRLRLGSLREIASDNDIADEVFPYLDGVFVANAQEQVFEELERDQQIVLNLLKTAADGDQIEIVEFEPD